MSLDKYTFVKELGLNPTNTVIAPQSGGEYAEPNVHLHYDCLEKACEDAVKLNMRGISGFSIVVVNEYDSYIFVWLSKLKKNKKEG
jgi:hypothetical protein